MKVTIRPTEKWVELRTRVVARVWEGVIEGGRDHGKRCKLIVQGYAVLDDRLPAPRPAIEGDSAEAHPMPSTNGG